MNPFEARNRAAALEQSGDMERARDVYRTALSQFDRTLTDSSLEAWLIERARHIETPESPAEEIASRMCRELPGWLVDYHAQRIATYFKTQTTRWLKLHWSIIEHAADLPSFDVTLRNLSGVLNQTFFGGEWHEMSTGDRKVALVSGERLVRVDASNVGARDFLRDAYRSEISAALPREYEPGKRKRRKRIRSGRRLSRRLQHHTRKAVTSGEFSLPSVKDSFDTLLWHYRLSGDVATGYKTAKRMYRLDKTDERSKKWLRNMRRMMRGRRPRD